MKRKRAQIREEQRKWRKQARAGADIFRSVGVPAVNTSGRYADGGYVSSGGRSGGEPIIIERVVIAIDSESIAIEGMSGENGRQLIVKQIDKTSLKRGIR